MLCIPELGTFFAILVPLYGNTKKKVSTFFGNLEDIIGTHLDSGTKEIYLKLYRAPLEKQRLHSYSFSSGLNVC